MNMHERLKEYMRKDSFLTTVRLSKAHVGMITRSGLAVFATLCIGFAWLFVGNAGVKAAGLIETPTQATPWAVAFDNSGHVWVAEPGCDAEPNCVNPYPSYIGEYARKNNTLVKNFLQPQGYSSPVFLIRDGKGNIWFSEPTTNAIGRLTPTSQPNWQQWKVPTANASPYDLTFDNNGNIWFTEFSGNKIGFFNTSTNQIVENAIPTSGSQPYGITKDKTGKIWFAENTQLKIASFVPTTSGKVKITEYGVSSASNPHLITADQAGNIWYSEGFSGDIGEFIPSTKVHKNIHVASGSSTHISGIAVDSKGRIWFDDSLGECVGVYTPSTGSVKTLTLSTPHAHPYDGLALDSNSNTWFTEEFASPNGMLGKIPAGML
jgi:virginiamycin B lyase